MGSELLDFRRGVERRGFLKGIGTVGAGLVLATFGGCESLCRQIEERPVRRRLRTGSPEVDAAIATYEQAVAAMKALPSSDPRSWTAQAAIHGGDSGFNFCEHGTNHFFSWHRAYLYYLEQICQELTGDDSFGLPYWNWNQTADIHPAFLDASSPLSHPRNATGVGAHAAFSDATLDTIFADTNFFTFGAQIEGSPHNTAHVLVGGDMGGARSARDPVFFAHHCMVDYCWAKWNIEQDNDNTNDGAWNDTSWDHFVTGDGGPVTVTAGVTTLMPLLGYRYESSAIGSSSAISALTAAELQTVERRIREGADVRLEIVRRVPVAPRVRLPLEKPFSRETRLQPADLAAILESDAATERIFASIDYAHPPPANDFFVRVFVGLPGAHGATPTDDPHYAGSFAFFGTHEGPHGDHQHRTDFLVDVTATLQRLRQAGELRSDTPISLQLVAVPVARELARPDAELVLEGIDLIVTPVRIRAKSD